MPLSTEDAVANLAVKDLEAAKKFYSETLGLRQVEEQDGELVTFSSGKTRLNVYRSQYAGTNQATAVTWHLKEDQLNKTISELRSKGVRFEHYDMPGLQLQGDLHVADGMKLAWFKDPDGNILNLVAQS